MRHGLLLPLYHPFLSFSFRLDFPPPLPPLPSTAPVFISTLTSSSFISFLSLAFPTPLPPLPTVLPLDLILFLHFFHPSFLSPTFPFCISGSLPGRIVFLPFLFCSLAFPPPLPSLPTAVPPSSRPYYHSLHFLSSSFHLPSIPPYSLPF